MHHNRIPNDQKSLWRQQNEMLIAPQMQYLDKTTVHQKSAVYLRSRLCVCVWCVQGRWCVGRKWKENRKRFFISYSLVIKLATGVSSVPFDLIKCLNSILLSIQLSSDPSTHTISYPKWPWCVYHIIQSQLNAHKFTLHSTIKYRNSLLSQFWKCNRKMSCLILYT